MNAGSDRIFQESILLAIALLEGGNPVIQVTGEGQPQPTFTLGTVTERRGVLTCCGGRSSSCWSFLPRKAEINKGSLVL